PATIDSWHRPFQGSPDPLLVTICQYMQQSGVESSEYARCAAFTQSSGTGKSWMNDELAKKIPYIPVNLGTTRDSFLSPLATSFNQSQNLQTKVAHCFIEALLKIAYNRLKIIVFSLPTAKVPADPMSALGDKLRNVASRFREKMSAGMTFANHGAYRVKFHEDVYGRAMENIVKLNSAAVVTGGSGSPTRKVNDSRVDLNKVAKDLVDLLSLDDSVKSNTPLVVVCFDEAHMLTTMRAGTSLFFELQRVLCTIRHLSIFTLFLSTTGSLEQCSPLSYADTSERVEKMDLKVLPPICLTPLDVLAEKFNPRGNWRLQKVASTRHMVHLGRPLFALRYDAGANVIRDNIFRFALTKLMCSHDHDISKLGQGKAEPLLACLGVRLPLNFKGLDSSLQRRLVSHHMRLLLYAEPGFTSLVTASPSEPVLAEAAYQHMGKRRWSADASADEKKNLDLRPYHLLDHTFKQTEIDLGTRGEIMAAALLLDAHDRATMY
ncbi:hypothetical protein C8Q80DRAFT_1052075, partial [Daedaleopsis nitida]